MPFLPPLHRPTRFRLFPRNHPLVLMRAKPPRRPHGAHPRQHHHPHRNSPLCPQQPLNQPVPRRVPVQHRHRNAPTMHPQVAVVGTHSLPSPQPRNPTCSCRVSPAAQSDGTVLGHLSVRGRRLLARAALQTPHPRMTFQRVVILLPGIRARGRGRKGSRRCFILVSCGLWSWVSDWGGLALLEFKSSLVFSV